MEDLNQLLLVWLEGVNRAEHDDPSHPVDGLLGIRLATATRSRCRLQGRCVRVVCIYVRMYVSMYVCIYVCMYICMYVCVCMYVCIYVCVCMY